MYFDLKKTWKFLKNFTFMDLDDEFSHLKIYLNEHNQGARAWDRLSVQGAINIVTRTITSSSSLSDRDYVIILNGSSPITATLPDATTNPGRTYILFNTGTAYATVATTSAQTINGATTTNIPAKYFHVEVFSDGSNWVAL